MKVVHYSPQFKTRKNVWQHQIAQVLMYVFLPKVWKRIRDDVLVVWTHDTVKLLSFLDYLNNIDDTGKIKFTMQIADEVNGLELLDLKIKCLKGKLSVDVYT